jgi:hypothetical protein
MNQARIENEKLNIEIREGATTISSESTLQANGSGSAGHLLKDDDIVCSAWKHAAAQKGGLEVANPSEHKVRFVFRVDGQPWWISALTGRYSDKTLSPFCAIEARA